MEKRFYYSPEMKFHQLKVKTSMLAGTTVDEGTEPIFEAKGGSLFFEEDED